MGEMIEAGKGITRGAKVYYVNARDLWQNLGGKGDFSDWVKRQLNCARLTEGRSVIKVTEKRELSKRGEMLIEYFFTLDATKHICMMSGTEKGFEVCGYSS